MGREEFSIDYEIKGDMGSIPAERQVVWNPLKIVDYVLWMVTSLPSSGRQSQSIIGSSAAEPSSYKPGPDRTHHHQWILIKIFLIRFESGTYLKDRSDAHSDSSKMAERYFIFRAEKKTWRWQHWLENSIAISTNENITFNSALPFCVRTSKCYLLTIFMNPSVNSNP